MNSRVTVQVGVITAAVLLVAIGAVADDLRGGLLYDKWWLINGTEEPVGDHPLYPPEGQKTGSTTFRCKECHGWDYKGADGAYGSGSHYTGIGGVFGTKMSSLELFALIHSPNGDGTGGTVVNGHDYGNIGLSGVDIWDLVDFLLIQVLDTDLYIGSHYEFLGDDVQGEWNYNNTGECFICHGEDGTAINMGTPEDPVWVGTVASLNPWEFLHKVRFGNPGTPMPSWLDNGGSDQGAADIGLHAQNDLPGGIPGGFLIFSDGFESGDSESWSQVVP